MYGYGIYERVENDVRIVGHSGGAPGISSNLDVYPDLGYAVAVMSNRDQGASGITDRARFMLTGHEWPRPVHVRAEALRSYLGKYSTVLPPDTPRGRFVPPFQIIADGESIALDFGSGIKKTRLRPLSATEFFDDENPEKRYTFSHEAGGEIVMTVTGQGSPIRNVKQP